MPQYAARASAVALSIAALASACAKELGGGGAGDGFDAVPNADASSIVVPQDGSSMASPDAGSASPPSEDASASIPEAGHTDDGGTRSETGVGEDASEDGASDDSGYAANGDADSAPPMSEAGGTDTSGPSCPMPVPESDTLPFAPDVGGKFLPWGDEGDGSAIAMPTDPTCGGHRANGSPLGNCHPITYTPLTSGGAQGWAGVLWQHPANNWGTVPGYAMPPGATKVSFWAKGGSGGEIVTFLVGSNGHPCSDTVSNSLSKVKLTTMFTRYEISLNGQTYAGGVIAAFGFVLAAADQPARDGGSTAFFIDDIEWQP